MSHHLTWIENDDDEGFEIELPEDFFGPRISWYKRLWYKLIRRIPPSPFELSEEEEVEVEEEFNKRVAVAGCVEAALASSVWVHRKLEDEMPNFKRYYVVGIGVRDRDAGDFWLYVELQPKDERRTFMLPLHEFLEQCYPERDLTFSDYHA